MLRKENGKFGKFSTKGGSKFLCQIGEGGGYEVLRRTREEINEAIMTVRIKVRLIIAKSNQYLIM